MPLHVRLIALVGIVLLASLAGGSLLVGWRVTHSVRTELRAALDGGVQTIRNGVDGPAQAADTQDKLRRLVGTFNGNRHVRASLLDSAGHTIAQSVLYPPPRDMPNWFLRLIGGGPRSVRLQIPQAGSDEFVVLEADPANETSEVWTQSRDTVVILAAFAALSALLISLVVGRALRSLERLSHAFRHVGDGDYRALLPESGPSELQQVVRGFNLMTERLSAIGAQNQRLNERLLSLQAEERADLARDLHDEIGPLLFAVDMTAAAIERLAKDDRGAEIPDHVHAIHDSVGRMQRHVRSLLGRLRPIQAIGLEAAIDRLTAFWRVRRPDIVFDHSILVEEDQLGNDLKETIYRVIQEGISNAIRHGRPTRVQIAITQDLPDGLSVTVTDDGVGMAADSIAGSSRLGLIGMRERVMAVAGSLSMQPGENGRGLSLVVRLPCEGSLEAQHLDTPE